MLTRRKFVGLLSLSGIAATIGCSDKSTVPVTASIMAPAAPMPDTTPAPPAPPAPSAAAPLPMLDPSIDAAKGLGYVAQASKADIAKFKTYAAGQRCGACSLFQAKLDATIGPCAIFPGKQVSVEGWCRAFAAKRA